MPESSRTHREFLPSAQQAIAELEEATGKPVLIVEEPELNVSATVRRARARQVLRANAGDGPRMDVVMYCASALETYGALALAAQKQLLMEVATAGQKGLALNRPEAKLQLRHYRNGEPISHLQAACMLFVGLKLLLPDQESAFDFEREYGVARGLVGAGKGNGS
jgi:hypothetical protein